jgi:hypothetical protein
MVQSLVHPQTKEAEDTLKSIGITPDFINQYGVFPAIVRLIEKVREMGVGGNVAGLGRLSDEDISSIEERFGAGAVDISDLGISGRGAEFLSLALRRIHGIRAGVQLVAKFDQLQEDMQQINDAWTGTADASREYADAVERFRSETTLAEAGASLQAIRQNLALALEPVLEVPARGITATARWMEENQQTTRNIALGSAAFLAALGIGRFAGAGRWPVLRRIPGLRNILGGAGRGFVMANAAQAALTQGGAGPGLSPQNPLYVVVVGQIFGGGGTSQPVPPVMGRGGGRGVFGRMRDWGGWITGGVAAGARLINRLPPGVKLGGGAALAGLGALVWPDSTAAFPYGERHAMNLARARQIDPNIEYLYRTRQVEMFGKASVELDIGYRDQSGKFQRKKVHIPMDQWAGGRTPSSQGRPGNRRGRGGR